MPDSLQLIRPYDPNSEANSIALSPRFIGTVLYANVLGKKLAGDGEIDAFFTKMAMTFTKGMVCDSAKVWKEEGGAGGYSSIMTNKSFGHVTDPREKLSKLEIPVLILKGQCDNVEWGFTSEYLEIYANSRLKIIPNAGHQIYLLNSHNYIWKKLPTS